MKLIMLCGQGISGKSTFAAQFQQMFNGKICVVRMDDVVKDVGQFDEPEYIKRVQQSLNSDFDYVLMDLAQDSRHYRRSILDQLNFQGETIDFVTYSMRPSLDEIFRRWTLRGKELTDEFVHHVTQVYNNFEYPTEEEFKKYNFNSVHNYVLGSNLLG